MSPHLRASTAIVACVASCLFAVSASAEIVRYHAELSGEAQIPPVETDATGLADITVDTEELTVTWRITHTALSGAAVAAHFHGPAAPEESAPPVIDLGSGAHGATADTEPAEGTDPPAAEGTGEAVAEEIMEGSALLTEEQIADLQAGRYYLNIHTAQNPDGEIRGQVVEGPALTGAAEQTDADAQPDGATSVAAEGDVVAGEKLFKSACRSCHGPKAQGMASFPKLAGRDAAYITDRLATYHAGETVGPNSRLMIPVAQKLSPEDMANVAAYIDATFD